METLVKVDIFFFISSVATVVLAILFSVLLCYLIKAGKNLHAISEMLKSEVGESSEYVEELKERLENNIIFKFFFPPFRRTKKSSKKENDAKK